MAGWGRLMPNGTYSGTYTYGLTLAFTSATFTASAVVDASAGNAVTGGAAHAYTVFNDGSLISSGGDGIFLAAGGAVTNGSTSDTAALIEGQNIGLSLATGTVENYGTIIGSTGAGVYVPAPPPLTQYAPVTVVNAGTIEGVAFGLELGKGGTVGNAGLIEATGSTGIGIAVTGAVATITNSGIVEGAGAGIEIVSGSIDNQGTIMATGAGGFGVDITGSTGIVTNSGVIEGYGGVVLKGAGTVENDGTIVDTHFSSPAVSLNQGLIVNNGLIEGSYLAITLSGIGTLDNGGTIQGMISFGGGEITNTGLIYGSAIIPGDGTIINHGTIIGVTRYAVAVGGNSGTIINYNLIQGDLDSGNGLLDNRGTIANDVLVHSTTGTLVNSGIINGTASLWFGTDLNNSGFMGGGITSIYYFRPATAADTITNSGTIYGTRYSVDLSTSATIDNLGTLASPYGLLLRGGTITNGDSSSSTSAVIEGPIRDADVVINYGTIGGIYGPANVSNFGTIVGARIGVYLGYRGAVVNRGTIAATLSGSGNGIGIRISERYGTITNYGTIEGTSYGVYSNVGGTVSNLGASAEIEGGIVMPRYTGIVTNTGGITGGRYGVSAGELTLTNIGTIQGVSVGALGGADSTLTNSGVIEGGLGVALTAAATLENSGTIIGTYARGAGVSAVGGTVENSGVIEGAAEGVVLSGAGTVINGGTIEGGTYAVEFLGTYADRLVIDPGAVFIGKVEGSGSLSVLELASGSSAGTLSGLGTTLTGFGTIAVDAGAAWDLGGATAIGTVIDAGTLEGAVYALEFTGAGAHRLVLDPGAAFIGKVDGGGSLGVLELASGSSAGTLVGLGTSITNFGSVEVDASAAWTLVGSVTIGAGEALTNDGTLTVAGTLDVETAVHGTGTLEIGAGATLELAAASTNTVEFAGTDAVLDLADTAGVTLGLGGFAAGSTIDLTGVAYSSTEYLAYSGGTLSIVENGATVASLTLEGLPAGTVLALAPDANGHAEILVETSAGNPSLSVMVEAVQSATLSDALLSLVHTLDAAAGNQHLALNFFTPARLAAPQAAPAKEIFGAGRIAGDINIANGAPRHAGESLALGAGIAGMVLTGALDAAIVGRAGPELLVGNQGDDTIRGGGGSGTIISGSGRNLIHTGRGDMVVSAGGTDTVYAGAGVDHIMTLGNATVYAGSGFT